MATTDPYSFQKFVDANGSGTVLVKSIEECATSIFSLDELKINQIIKINNKKKKYETLNRIGIP
jgi:hypothetical protein